MTLQSRLLTIEKKLEAIMEPEEKRKLEIFIVSDKPNLTNEERLMERQSQEPIVLWY